MKKLIFIFIVSTFLTNVAYSQQMVIHFKNGKTVKYDITQIEKITYSNNSQLNNHSLAKFVITKQRYDINEVKQAALSEFGTKYRVADWNDILQYKNDIQDFVRMIGGMEGEYASLSITANGKHFYGGSRHFFISLHKHNKPSSYLAHANIDNYYLSLGSWTGKRHVLCIRR